MSEREQTAARCDVCFHRCRIPEGGKGFCGARTCVNGKILPENYGKITGFALDPIEKKAAETLFSGTDDPFGGQLRLQSEMPFLPES